MSYTTQDRFGDMVHKYVPPKKGELTGAPATWWPDYGSSTRDISYQENCGPTSHLFKSKVQNKSASRLEPMDAPQSVSTCQFRHPVAAREAILRESDAQPAAKLRARAATEKQGSLRRLELRQRKIDSWLDSAPIQVESIMASRSRSESTLNSLQSSDVSTQVYSRYGFLPERGLNGDKPLGMRSAVALSTPPGDGPRAIRMGGKQKPRKAWRLCPESRYTLDPVTFLPIPKAQLAARQRGEMIPIADTATPELNSRASPTPDLNSHGSPRGSRVSHASSAPGQQTPSPRNSPGQQSLTPCSAADSRGGRSGLNSPTYSSPRGAAHADDSDL